MIKCPSTPLGFLQNWRLTEAEIDGFCHFWYNGIVDQHVRVKPRLFGVSALTSLSFKLRYE